MASRDKIFLDTDVTLDHLADRQPFSEYAHRILALAESGDNAVNVLQSYPPDRIVATPFLIHVHEEKGI